MDSFSIFFLLPGCWLLPSPVTECLFPFSGKPDYRHRLTFTPCSFRALWFQVLKFRTRHLAQLGKGPCYEAINCGHWSGMAWKLHEDGVVGRRPYRIWGCWAGDPTCTHFGLAQCYALAGWWWNDDDQTIFLQNWGVANGCPTPDAISGAPRKPEGEAELRGAKTVLSLCLGCPTFFLRTQPASPVHRVSLSLGGAGKGDGRGTGLSALRSLEKRSVCYNWGGPGWSRKQAEEMERRGERKQNSAVNGINVKLNLTSSKLSLPSSIQEWER